VIPNKVFQALACGAPVVTADTRAVRELLDERSAVLVPPGDAAGLAEAVGRLASDPELAARTAAAGLDAYRRNASEEILGARWRVLLESLR
jgi:glycosyltransferase involved in cell wall biosynthesis